jgi:hypothetical protein
MTHLTIYQVNEDLFTAYTRHQDKGSNIVAKFRLKFKEPKEAIKLFFQPDHIFVHLKLNNNGQ